MKWHFRLMVAAGIGLSVGLGLAAVAHAQLRDKSVAPTSFGHLTIDKLIVMPNAAGHADWIAAINAAQASIHMTMYHLTDQEVISALIAANNRKLDVRIIVDGKSLTGGYKAAITTLTSAGVQVQPSSTAFSLTHSKDMVVDNKKAFIGAIDMTNTATDMRDFAVITSDKNVILEVENVFQADWANGENNTALTPPLSVPDLIWSPTSSDNKLQQFIDSAQSTLVIESENFDNTDIINSLNNAVVRGVNVRMILPECSLGNAELNYQGIALLNGVSVRMEHDGESLAQPYMHSKMAVADGDTVYVGSINLSFNSILDDREVGLIFQDGATATRMVSEFEVDWNRSDMPALSSAACPADD